jgi:hypothetical protein
MDQIKVSLNVILPGRVMFSKRDCLKEVVEKKELKNGKTKYLTKLVQDDTKFETLKIPLSPLIVRYRKSIPATQTLNISCDSYRYMTSKECPAFMRPKEWASMSKKMRLESHLKNIAESLGGKLGTYHVFED